MKKIINIPLAKKLDFIWCLGTNTAPEKWPKKFEGSSCEVGSSVDHIASHFNQGRHQTLVYHDESLQTGEVQSWLFSEFHSVKFFPWVPISMALKGLDNSPTKTIPNDSKLFVEDFHPVYFVCSHGTRDERCGAKGPEIVTELRKQGLRTFSCSHLGGHAFAGNVLCLPSSTWFAQVEKDNADGISKQLASGSSCSVPHCRGCSW